MNTRLLSVALRLATLAFCLCTFRSSLAAPISDSSPDQIEGKTYRLERAYYVIVHVPAADVDKVMKAVVAAVGLEYGKYDQVAYIDALGLELFRPLDGSKAGAQSRASRQPTKIVSFSVAHDTAVLQKALDAVYAAHSYEEPVIYVSEVWRSRSTNTDESNPNRWWNQKPKN
jgi:hypothetical protein